MNSDRQTLEILVSPTGQAIVRTRGYSGPACQEASRFLEQALGEPTSEQKTADFYQPQVTSQEVKQR